MQAPTSLEPLPQAIVPAAPELFQPGIYSGLDEDRYHASAGVSVSRLKRFAEAPAKAFAPVKETKALRLGSLIHTALLEPSKLAARYHVHDLARVNDNDGATKRERERAQGRELVSRREFEAALAMRQAVMAQPVARDLLPYAESEYGHIEQSFYWRDADTGLLRRGRADLRINHHVFHCLVDLKSTEDASPDGFTRTIGSYRYHWQAASYLDGIEACTGERPEFFVFLAIEKEPPFLVGPYIIHTDDLADARAELKVMLARYAECERTGIWPGYVETLTTLRVPGWARLKELHA